MEWYWLIYDGTGSVWGDIWWYWISIGRYWLVLGGTGSLEGILGQYKAVRAESIWVSGGKGLK